MFREIRFHETSQKDEIKLIHTGFYKSFTANYYHRILLCENGTLGIQPAMSLARFHNLAHVPVNF